MGDFWGSPGAAGMGSYFAAALKHANSVEVVLP